MATLDRAVGPLYLVLLFGALVGGAAIALGFVGPWGSPSLAAPAPFPLILLGFTFVPPMLLPLIAGGVSILWSIQIAFGNPTIPVRTAVLAISIAVGSLGWFAAGWRYGLQYQGRSFVWFTALFSVLFMVLVGAAVSWGRRRPSLAASTLAHGLIFLWLFSYAFPYLGETP